MDPRTRLLPLILLACLLALPAVALAGAVPVQVFGTPNVNVVNVPTVEVNPDQKPVPVQGTVQINPKQDPVPVAVQNSPSVRVLGGVAINGTPNVAVPGGVAVTNDADSPVPVTIQGEVGRPQPVTVCCNPTDVSPGTGEFFLPAHSVMGYSFMQGTTSIYSDNYTLTCYAICPTPGGATYVQPVGCLRVAGGSVALNTFPDGRKDGSSFCFRVPVYYGERMSLHLRNDGSVTISSARLWYYLTP